ncbi:hypothetical protein OPV22_019865 [Ensete ventricosum]|uniref:Uncharacterized protein n=1 Tax=Ensete ventricosum TaxID=4639 RepID=A0AAV8QIW3_ENSVE|nr:hypothetical protein OPV22_019865 [Ensete ventricosum]
MYKEDEFEYGASMGVQRLGTAFQHPRLLHPPGQENPNTFLTQFPSSSNLFLGCRARTRISGIVRDPRLDMFQDQCRLLEVQTLTRFGEETLTRSFVIFVKYVVRFQPECWYDLNQVPDIRRSSWAGSLLHRQPSLGCRELNPCCHALDEAAGVASDVSRTIMLVLRRRHVH